MIRIPIIIPALLFALSLSSPVPATSAALHFGLTKSLPEDGATVEAPSEVRLWFSEVPQEGTTSIRLLDAGGSALETGDVTQDSKDAKSFSVSISDPLPPGAYGVAWRAMGSDGHVVRGTFSFTVAAG